MNRLIAAARSVMTSRWRFAGARSARAARPAEPVRAHRHEIVHDWERAIRPLVVARRLPHPALAGQVDELLDGIAEMVDEPAAGRAGPSAAKGLRFAPESFEDGNLREVLDELAVLRNCVMKRLDGDAPRPRLMARLRQLNRATDRAVSEAAERTEQLRRESLARWQSMLDYTPAAVFIRDLTGRFVLVSRSYAETFGIDPCRASGRTIRELHPDRPRELVDVQEATDRRIIETGTPIEREETYTIRGEDRTHVMFEFPLRESSGKVNAVCGISVDITVRKRVEEAQSRLIAIVGHDLRNPVGAIALAARMLLSEELTPAARARIVARIARSAERMNRMIAELLDFTRAHVGGGLPIALGPADLGAITRDVVDELTTALPDLSIETRYVGDLTGIWDQERMAQVVSNLVSNAAHHRVQQTPVRVDVVANHDGDVHLTVKNKGRDHLDAAQLSRLFAPFFRGEALTSAQTSTSLGLGLYIVREIVRAHGGSVEARSSEDDEFSVLVRVPKTV